MNSDIKNKRKKELVKYLIFLLIEVSYFVFCFAFGIRIFNDTIIILITIPIPIVFYLFFKTINKIINIICILKPKKYRYKKLSLKRDELLLWLQNNDKSEKIIILDNNIQYSIEIKYDFQDGRFTNREIRINNKEYTKKDAYDFFSERFNDITLLWSSEYKKPIMFNKTIVELKTKYM